jgi:hypothetical protein
MLATVVVFTSAQSRRVNAAVQDVSATFTQDTHNGCTLDFCTRVHLTHLQHPSLRDPAQSMTFCGPLIFSPRARTEPVPLDQSLTRYASRRVKEITIYTVVDVVTRNCGWVISFP